MARCDNIKMIWIIFYLSQIYMYERPVIALNLTPYYAKSFPQNPAAVFKESSEVPNRSLSSYQQYLQKHRNMEDSNSVMNCFHY